MKKTLLFITDIGRRRLSRLLSSIIPNFHSIKLRVKAFLSIYSLLPFRSKSKEKRLICLYRAKGPFGPGLADRLKAMVTGYIIAKTNNRSYYIFHDNGFMIEDYLVPAKEDWRIDINDVSFGIFSCKRAWFVKSLIKLDDSAAEYHFLGGGNVADKLTGEQKNEYDFHRIFHTLFRPSAIVQQEIDSINKQHSLSPDSYIAVHIRFLDFFENVEQKRVTAFTQHASIEEQREMIASINHTLAHLLKEHENKKLLLFSDSPTFLAVEHPNGVHTIPGDVGHIYAHEGQKPVILKAFVDLFLISHAYHVYNIVGAGTYTSGYSYVGALIGNKPFKRIERLRPIFPEQQIK